jgi:hypothetical protein
VYRDSYASLRYTPGDYDSFARILAGRLRERGLEPEIDMSVLLGLKST